MQSVTKYRHAVRLQRIRDRVWSAVTFGLHRLVTLRTLSAASSKLFGVTVQYQLVGLLGRHSHSVIRSCHRCKAAHKEQLIFSVLALADETVDASVRIVRIDPLEASPAAVEFLKRRILPVNMKQFFHPVLDMLVIRIVEKEPIQLTLLTPLAKLCKFLSHK